MKMELSAQQVHVAMEAMKAALYAGDLTVMEAISVGELLNKMEAFLAARPPLENEVFYR